MKIKFPDHPLAPATTYGDLRPGDLFILGEDNDQGDPINPTIWMKTVGEDVDLDGHDGGTELTERRVRRVTAVLEVTSIEEYRG